MDGHLHLSHNEVAGELGMTDIENNSEKDEFCKFDKENTDMMVKGHKDAIETFEKAAADATDADIKQWAAASLPTLRTHLDYAMICQKKYDKMK